MKRTLLILLLAFAPASLVAQAGLDSLLSRALEHSPSLQAARSRLEAARLQAPQAAALPDLKVGAGYFAVPIETRLGPQRLALSVSQSFPWFGQLGAEEAAAETRARQAEADLADARSRLLLDVRSAWYRWYVLERSIARTREQLAFLETVEALIRVRYETGKTGYSDVLRVEMEKEELATRIRSLEDGRPALLRQLEQLTGLPVTTAPALPDSLGSPPLLPAEEEIAARLEQRNPQLRRAAQEGEYWRHRGDAARLMGYPMFTVGLNYFVIDPPSGGMTVENPGRDAIQPQLGLSIPLFGSRYSAMEEQAAMQESAARSLREDVRYRLRRQLEERLRDHRDARRRLDLNTRLTALAERTRDLALQEYSTGMKSLEDVLAIERGLLRYALAREQAEADLHTTHHEIMYLTAEE
jgi:outer membrane protein TolC